MWKYLPFSLAPTAAITAILKHKIAMKAVIQGEVDGKKTSVKHRRCYIQLMTVKQLRQVQWSKIRVYCHCICCNVSFITSSCHSWRLKISPQFQNIHILLCQVFQAVTVNINVHVKAIKLWSYSAYAIFIQTKTAMDRGMLEKSLLYKKNVLSSPCRCSILTIE